MSKNPWPLLPFLAVIICMFAYANRHALRYHRTRIEMGLRWDPRTTVERYLHEIRNGDIAAANGHWIASGAIRERRERVSGELQSFGPELEFHIVDMQWWRICCWRERIEDPNDAGMARITVAVSGGGKQPRRYVFDVVATHPHSGPLNGTGLRRWILRDVYAEGEDPLAFPDTKPAGADVE